MNQNTIAVVWDFDKTLIDGYMQIPIFKKYNVEESLFWQEVNEIANAYEEKGIKVNRDSFYLNHIITCIKQGVFPGLNNDILFDLGKELIFYKGIPDIFQSINNLIMKNENYQKFNISIEHYIVSTGFAQMIKGSVIANYVKGIWGCEFIEEPIQSKLSNEKQSKKSDTLATKEKELTQVVYSVDNTTKTRAIYEINKGVNIYKDIDVNAKISLEDRRIPFENIIYIADGPSDVPAFSVLKNNGGQTFAIYPKGDMKAFKQVDLLRKDGRVDMYGEADYTEGTITHLWLLEHINDIAKKVYDKQMSLLKKSVSVAPQHIND